MASVALPECGGTVSMAMITFGQDLTRYGLTPGAAVTLSCEDIERTQIRWNRERQILAHPVIRKGPSRH